jgi:hypothetical protein
MLPKKKPQQKKSSTPLSCLTGAGKNFSPFPFPFHFFFSRKKHLVQYRRCVNVTKIENMYFRVFLNKYFVCRNLSLLKY